MSTVHNLKPILLNKHEIHSYLSKIPHKFVTTEICQLTMGSPNNTE
jgi:hypothetical protein